MKYEIIKTNIFKVKLKIIFFGIFDFLKIAHLLMDTSGLKMRFSPLFCRLVHRNCQIFGTKVNLGNTYTLAILKLFEKILSPSNSP